MRIEVLVGSASGLRRSRSGSGNRGAFASLGMPAQASSVSATAWHP